MGVGGWKLQLLPVGAERQKYGDKYKSKYAVQCRPVVQFTGENLFISE